MGTITVLSPAAASLTGKVSAARRPGSLNGKVMGILWNGKPNGDIMLRRVQEQLTQRLGLAGSVWKEKPGAAHPADKAVIAELASKADFVVVGAVSTASMVAHPS